MSTALKDSSLLRSITALDDIPVRSKDCVRVASYNVTADFFDGKDTTPDGHHRWQYRAPFVKKIFQNLEADIICLQELSLNQAAEFKEYFEGYKSVFLSQTPSDLEAGAIAYDKDIIEWKNKGCKNIGTPLICIFVRGNWKVAHANRFWLNENPDDIPQNFDRGETNKGFNNMNTYRAVLWVKIENDAQNSLFVFNSHYPLSGNGETRLKCAELEMRKIKEITGNSNWISAGDRNLIPAPDDNENTNPEAVYSALVKDGHDVRDAKKHYGISTTWLGFSYDAYKNEIDSATHDFKRSIVLDVMVSSMIADISFIHHGAIDPATKSLTSLSKAITQQQDEERYFSSDHAIIGGDFVCL